MPSSKPADDRRRRARAAAAGVRSLLAQGAAGAAVGWAVLAGLLATDAAGLATLIVQSDLGSVALLLLALQFGGGFATFAVATGLALPPANAPRGKAEANAPRLVPITWRKPR